ncbi:hypothetical protein CHLNCDRAFT_26868 [Chlorella variabilis]|uniref:Thioredoxin n=1 Tax=Chlorella variabilis TaxID=554065 RepID=E1ZNW6_CHLVA|nr:hypothetical protein CHLNCDRAFT_26868 [Chlorella variabilis]EFN52510.1 hypothetical protein CHLNCDRAFT_26868 [Chlorella variabilis]|eukprot:XP_005844612.1 hypothetical protein CHLNCDRAFT_26868 [Chlorella variabilis]
MAKFQQMIASSPTPVLVDFFTQWCGPCHQLNRNMKATVIEPVMKDRVKFEKIDTEQHPAVADHFHIHKLPTLVLFKDGQAVDRVEGLMSAQDLQMYLLKLLK